MEYCHEINKDGTSILLVEQSASRALEICQRGYIFEIGKIAIEGEREGLLNNEDIKKVILESADGSCPYCGSWKVGPAGGFAARASSSSKLPEPIRNYYCDDCQRLF